jgi:uncharacterized OsmC-like protein
VPKELPVSEITSSTSTQTLQVIEGFRGVATVKSFAPIPFDEPADVGGADSAPAPTDYLLTAVASCLLSSLSFCLQKKRVEAGLTADATARVARDEAGLLRVESIDVHLRVGVAEEDWKKVEGCYGIFKKYCIVSASVARGIPIETTLERVPR